MTEKENDQAIILGALLYNIGRFGKRAYQPPSVSAGEGDSESQEGFETYSAKLVGELPEPRAAIKDALHRLVLKSHMPSLPDEKLIHLACNISMNEFAGTKNSQEASTPKTWPALRRVLSRIEMKGQKADATQYEPLIPFPLSGGSIDSELLYGDQSDSVTTKDYQGLWNSFIQELKQTPSTDITTILALLKKYTWSVPIDSGTNSDPDVSLYAQSKAMAAVAACLLPEQVGDAKIKELDDAFTALLADRARPPVAGVLDEPLFALVKGDISGTQDFLYLLASSGAARGLRGRSFYLQLLTETIASWLLRKFEIPSTNLLFVGGGHFYLLLPYRKTTAKLMAWREEITRKLWEAHTGDLSITVDFVPVSAMDFAGDIDTGGFAAKWGEVSRRVNERKRKKLLDFSDDTLGQFLKPKQLGATDKTTCSICHGEWLEGRDREEEDIRKCNRCEGFEELGKKLRNPAYLITFMVEDAEPREGGDWMQVLRSFGAEVRLLEATDPRPAAPAGAIAASVSTLDSADFLNNKALTAFRWNALPISHDFRFLANATPRKGKHEIADFEDLAEASEGVKWLGVLRMDVDNLSHVIRDGLGKRASIARVSTLSDSLRLFFEGWAPQLCRRFNTKKEGGEDQVYLIYAGGDDLFIVGAWSALPDLAKKIRDDFRAYVGGNQVSLSAGIAIEHQKYPLYQLANDAKHALDERAKEFKRENGLEKDALTFLQTTAGWEQFEHIENWKNRIRAMLKPGNGDKALSRGFLTRLGEIHYLYEANAKLQRQRKREEGYHVDQMREEIRYAKWMWRLVYHLGRFREAYSHFDKDILQFQVEIVVKNLIERINVIARWTELLTREEKK